MSTITPPSAQQALQALQEQISTIIHGKSLQIADGICCLLAGGHLLIEDQPGVGKTTLAQALALSLGLQFSRVQFTSDLMPSDLLGASVYTGQTALGGEPFRFHPGPVFTQVLLADEINRAGPRTQSALLEAMEERQVSVDGQTHTLPQPFFVIATQNPSEQLGTHPLPESQLDRFLMCISLGLPDRKAERELLAGQDRREALRQLRPVINQPTWQRLQALVPQVHASDALLDYLQALLAASRSGEWFVQGLSPRAGLAVLRAARARALQGGRMHVLPDDVQAILPQTVAHRLQPRQGSGRGARAQVQAMLAAVPLP